ncbi:hypothetical protein FJ959_13890 [Mesorhizobium sp. B2-2-4]|uniref:hypothetical protein n=1 Tax=unclassified Mesorhizobium TaxID=325217 RepID=UPI00112BE41E|nr:MULTISPECIES: hypothetical protein [unclassified Mesorhizobium]TPJ40637.1 hypothetical protein FJ437_25595 [Mesorhizobium sp. B2-6-6]MCA0000152.1 hypothetical protein [Mesorhizobium sp. B264B2A]MCA0006203.1 hypothetical protein [Mesorhizobium sp. B264B1B]MCA0017794.1 hypothetical protein [Mesorhizobium sp. B264B1A]TPM56172.1 hypothetical protein FJ959_13890 [Mesorhizobium sp. B2-2-4]
MSGLETAALLLIEAICGAGGAFATTWFWRMAALGWKSVAAAGVVGGLALTGLAGRIPALANFLGNVENAVDATARGVGTLTPGVLIGVGIAGLLGGILSVCIIGLVRGAGSGRR